MTNPTALSPVEELCADIQAQRGKRLKSLVRQNQKQPYFYLSGLHSCVRNLYYLLEAGDQRPAADEHLQALFEAGKEQERLVMRELLEMGYDLAQQQQSVEVRYAGPNPKHRGQKIGSGKIDASIKWKGLEIPTEVKAMDPNMFKRIREGAHGVDDLLQYDHTERYVRQLLMYLYAKNLEMGFFLIVDFKGHWKLIPVFLGNHLEVAELALRNMEIAWDARAAGKEPDRIQFHHGICGKCAFQTTCLPTVEIAGAERIDDPEEEARLAREIELKPLADEYKQLHETTTERYRAGGCNVGGKFAVTVKKQTRTKLDKKLLTPEQAAAATVSYEVDIVKVEPLTTEK